MMFDKMISCKEDALEFFRKTSGKTQFKKNELEASVEILQKIAADEGLSEDEIDQIVKCLTVTKINSKGAISLFDCLIPKTRVSNFTLEGILLWFFTEVGNYRMSTALGKKCLQWLAGVTYYELGDTSVIDSYYHSFIFLLSNAQLERPACRLLCLISKPEDATRWVVQQILNISSSGNLKPHAYALLSLLKSYRPSVVPEKIPLTSFHYTTTPFDDLLKKAHDRKMTEAQAEDSTGSDIKWNMLTSHNGKRSNRLIPTAEGLGGDNGENNLGNRLQSIYEFKTMSSLGIRPFMVECPAETLSLLANTGGYHILAFSDQVVQARFFHKLNHTLCRVFLLELKPYTEDEKIFFLNCIKQLQEYTQQSIPLVTTFLYLYLAIWNGEEYRKEILGLLEWLEIREIDDLEKYVFSPLRQIFISSDTQCKCLIVETMRKLMRNLLIMDKKELYCFGSNGQNCNGVKCIEAIGKFVGGLVSNGLIWSKEEKTRSFLNSAFDFYETAQAVEQAGDLPLMMVMPPALVYECLFSGSRVWIERLCSHLVNKQLVSVERLHLLGVFQDFAVEVSKLNVYLLDYYRCLWSKLDFKPERGSFIFEMEIFTEKFWKLREMYGDVVDRLYGIEYNASFWNPKAMGVRWMSVSHLSDQFPSTVMLKQVVEKFF